MKTHKMSSLSLDDYIEVDDLDKCAVCGKYTTRHDSLELLDINLKPSWWHCECYASFTAYNRSKCWDTYEDMERLQNEPDGFVKVTTTLMKAIRAEEQLRRQQQKLALTV